MPSTSLKFRPALSNKQKNMLSRATVLASMSTQRHKHGAIIVKGGAVISTGVNRHKNDPRIFDTDFENIRKASVHAEVAAIRGAGFADLNGAVIYVARVNNHGQQMMSKPCEQCQQALKQAGIKKVVYTIDSEMDLD